MPEEHHLTARNLLEQMNRQFNECNALYHELAVHYGVSDTVFWLLYTLYNSSEPQTQNRLCMEWNLPKQTMNSAVASMVKQGLLELEPAPGRYSGKLQLREFIHKERLNAFMSMLSTTEVFGKGFDNA